MSLLDLLDEGSSNQLDAFLRDMQNDTTDHPSVCTNGTVVIDLNDLILCTEEDLAEVENDQQLAAGNKDDGIERDEVGEEKKYGQTFIWL